MNTRQKHKDSDKNAYEQGQARTLHRCVALEEGGVTHSLRRARSQQEGRFSSHLGSIPAYGFWFLLDGPGGAILDSHRFALETA